MEGRFAGEFDAEHHHASHPEEEDIRTGLEHRGGIEIFEIFGLFGPAQRGERPQSGGEPGIQHVFILVDLVAVAVGTLGGVLARHGHFAAVIAVPHGDAVPPPELAADAPITDVLQPVVIDFGEALRHNAGFSAADGFQRLVGQGLNFDEPLGGDHGFDNLAAALRAGHVERVRLLFDNQVLSAHIFPEFLAALETVHASILAAVLIDMGLFVENVDEFQPMCLTNGIIVGVVRRGDLDRTGTKLTIDIFIRDDRNAAADDGYDHVLAQILLVTLIFRMDGHSGITQNGLGAGGGYRDIFAGTVGEHVFEIIEETRFFGIFHFEIRNGGSQIGRPVDHARAAVNKSFFVKGHKCLTNGDREPFIKGEAGAVPVTGGPQTADLVEDLAAVFFFPFPGAAQKFLAADVIPFDTFFSKGFFHQHLRGNTGMIRAGNPKGGHAFHAVVADHQIFHRDKHGMAQMQFTGNVGRRDGNDERLFRGVKARRRGIIGGFEIAFLFPHFIETLLY